MGNKLGIDMNFAQKFNEQVREEQRDQETDYSEGEGDDMYFDDVSGMDSWDQRSKENKQPRPAPQGTTLNLSNLHNGIAWGDGIKADSSPAKLERKATREKVRPREPERSERKDEGRALMGTFLLAAP